VALARLHDLLWECGAQPRPDLHARSAAMTSREVAELLEVPISTVLEWGRNGTLPRVKLGRHVRFIRTHVEAAILEIEQPRRR
jgi:excisionase family DNA binding protein